MKEQWRDIEGYSNYAVSDKGQIKNKKTNKILHQEISKVGYPTVRISNSLHKKKYLNVHVLVAKAFLEDRNECVNHKDGDKTNNNVENLEWCSYAYNNQHAYDMGLKHARGLSSEEAKKIRKLVDNASHYSPVIDLTTGKKYKSIKSTKEDGFRPGGVQKVCAGNAKTHLGHVFAYAEKVVTT